MPAIRIERPGPLSGYVDALVAAMNATGQRLKELGEPDMARFLLSALKGEGDQPTAARLVSALAAAFPATFGEALPSGSGPQGSDGGFGFVSHKKALVLAGESYHRLRHALPALAFADFARAPGYATPAVITHLVALGVLAPPEGEWEGDEEAARARLLGDPGNVAVLAAAAVVALDAVAAKWEGEGVAPLDVAYFFDEVYGKEKGQGQGQGQQMRDAQGQEEGQGPEQGEAVALKFVPPRGQTVM